jgi:hypothetical protein
VTPPDIRMILSALLSERLPLPNMSHFVRMSGSCVNCIIQLSHICLQISCLAPLGTKPARVPTVEGEPTVAAGDT